MNQGEVTVFLRLEDKQFKASMVDAEGNIKQFVSSASNTGRATTKINQIGDAFNNVADLAGGALKVISAVALTGSIGFGASAKAAWNQVDAVQQAESILRRYYGTGKQTNAVLSELINYAQSDMGVLFNRKDLFAAASNLAMYKQSAADVTDQVKILSRGMASNVISWDEMNAVVGRVLSSGRLTTPEFEMLAKAGYNLDESLRNSTLSADEFFDALDNSIPKDISQDMDNITPVGIRFQTALRGIGNELLGVNETGNKFVQGGFGDTMITMFQEFTAFLKTPEMKEGIRNLGTQMSEFMRAAMPVIQNVLSWLVNNMDNIIAGVAGLAAAFVAMKVGAFVTGLVQAVIGFKTFITAIRGGQTAMAAFNLVASANPFGIIVMAIAAVVAALTYLQIKFNIFGIAWDMIKSIWGAAVAWFQAVWNGIVNVFSPVVSFYSRGFTAAWNAIKAVWSGVVSFFSGLWGGIVRVFSPVISWFRNLFSGAWNGIRSIWSGVTGFFSGIGSGIRTTFNNVVTGIRGAFENAVSFVRGIPGKILGALGNLGSTLFDSGKSLIGGFTDGIKNAFNSAKDFVGGKLGELRDLFPFSPAKEGPFSGRGYTTFSGMALMKDFAKGIGRTSSMAVSEAMGAMTELQDALSTTITPSFAVAGSYSAGMPADDIWPSSGSQSGDSSPQIVQNNYPQTPIDMDVINDSLMRAARRR